MPKIDGRRTSSDAINAEAVTNPATDSSIIAVLKGLLTQLQGSGSGSNPVSLSTLISSEVGDNIDVSKMTKGGVTTAHNGIVETTTSSEIDCRGFNSASVECVVSNIGEGNWVVEVLGCAVSGLTFGSCYVLYDSGWEKMTTPSLEADENFTFIFVGIPNYIKVKATRTTAGTLTCKVTLINL